MRAGGRAGGRANEWEDWEAGESTSGREGLLCGLAVIHNARLPAISRRSAAGGRTATTTGPIAGTGAGMSATSRWTRSPSRLLHFAAAATAALLCIITQQVRDCCKRRLPPDVWRPVSATSHVAVMSVCSRALLSRAKLYRT